MRPSSHSTSFSATLNDATAKDNEESAAYDSPLDRDRYKRRNYIDEVNEAASQSPKCIP